MVQATEVNFDGFSTEFGKCLDYLHYDCFTFSSILAKQSSPLLLIRNKLMKYFSCVWIYAEKEQNLLNPIEQYWKRKKEYAFNSECAMLYKTFLFYCPYET